MLHCVALLRTNVSEELITSIIRVTRMDTLGITLAAPVLQLLVTVNVPSSPILLFLMMAAIRSSEMSVHTRATQHNIPEGDIHHIHCCEDLKSHKDSVQFIWFLLIG
jgi:hypothetical protein